MIPAEPITGSLVGKLVTPVAIEAIDWTGPDYQQHEIHIYLTQQAQECRFVQSTPGFWVGFPAPLAPGQTVKTATTTVHGTGQPFAAALWEKSGTEAGLEGNGWLSAVIDDVTDDVVRGRVFAWFDDAAKSMIVGAFVAKRCKNSPMNP